MNKLLARRVQALGDRVAATGREADVPGSVRWLRVLRVIGIALDRTAPSPEVEAAKARVRDSIGLLEEYVATALDTDPWVYLESYCQACVYRLAWTRPGWEGRRVAVLEP